jgi:predicted nucleotidyltransferase
MVPKREIGVVSQIIQNFGASRIILFGSCAYKSIEEAHDIDILCYGVDSSRWLEMCNEVGNSVSSAVDIVDAQDIDEELRRDWEGYGKLLFARNTKLKSTSD